MSKQDMNEIDLLETWIGDMLESVNNFKEPILDESIMKIMKITCDAFKQDVHVFITAVEILEEYMRRKYEKQECNYDQILILAASLFISSKYTGVQIELKIKYINKILQRLTNVEYESKIIISAEVEILKTLDGSLPITTVVDDLNTIIELHIRENHLKANLRLLCLEILQLLYICRKNLFMELKEIYNQNKDSLLVLKFLMNSKLYIPVCILITSLHLTQYKHILDINSMTNNITRLTKIHSDHLNILAGILINLIQNNI
ncbi:hypothetical protein HHI36_016077 [Cryptolaemus montrouzieri]|uniref:Cyclin N-terminal domain-containing protein n=1 Tax=Cryptolaemus montrouzieri TaxID=559131 RepID=A0ABD2N8M2_9CUCU